MSVVRPLRACLIWAVGTLLLTATGCSSGDVSTAKPENNPVSSATGAGDPRITPATAAGIESFVRAYYAEVARAIATGDTTVLVTYSRPTCSCRRLVSLIQGAQLKHQTLSPLSFNLESLRSALERNGAIGSADLVYDAPSQTLRDHAGRLLSTAPAVKGGRQTITLVWASGHWVINEVIGLDKQ